MKTLVRVLSQAFFAAIFLLDAPVAMDHSTHHRGSSIAYLRINGAEPPAFVGF